MPVNVYQTLTVVMWKFIYAMCLLKWIETQSDSVSAGQTCVCFLTGISSSEIFKTIYHNGNFCCYLERENFKIPLE